MVLVMKPHHHAVGFGLGVALIAACTAQMGYGLKLAPLAHFHTIVKGGIWADLGVTATGFLLGFMIWRRVVTTHPPIPSELTGLVFITSMAIKIALIVAASIAYAILSPLKDWIAMFAMTFAMAWIYFLFTACLPLILLMAAWTMVWAMLCSREAAQPSPSSPSPASSARNIRARYRVWIPPAEVRIAAPRWWLALTFGDDDDTSAAQDGGTRKDGADAAT